MPSFPHEEYLVRDSPLVPISIVDHDPWNIKDLWHLKPTKSAPTFQENLPTQLLISQALLDSNNFEHLPFEQLERLKEEHEDLVERTAHLQHTIQLETRIRNISRSLRSMNGRPIDEKDSEVRLKELVHRLEYMNIKRLDIQETLLKHTAGVLHQGLLLRVREMDRVRDTLNCVGDLSSLDMMMQRTESDADRLRQAEKQLDTMWERLSYCATKRQALEAEREQYKSELNRHKLNRHTQLKERLWKTHLEMMECKMNTLMVHYDRIITTAMDLESYRTNYDQRLSQLTSSVCQLESCLWEERARTTRGSDTTELYKEFRLLLSTIQLNHKQRLDNEMQDKLQLKKQIQQLQQNRAFQTRHSIQVQTD